MAMKYFSRSDVSDGLEKDIHFIHLQVQAMVVSSYADGNKNNDSDSDGRLATELIARM